MIYSEAAYFDGAHVAHCAAREDAMRLARIDRDRRAIVASRTGARRRIGRVS